MKKRKQKRVDSLRKKISNRLSYTIIAFVGLMLLGIFVFAAAPNPGHSYTELDLGPITIDGNNVGIGTTEANSKLSVGHPGSTKYAINAITYADGGIGVYASADTGVYGYGDNVGVQAYGANYDFYTSHDAGKSYFAGDVGIGVDNPSKKLEVDGQVKATGFCIGTSCITSWGGGGGGTPTLSEVLTAGHTASTMIDMNGRDIADVHTLNLVNTGKITADDGQVDVQGKLNVGTGLSVGGNINTLGSIIPGNGISMNGKSISMTDGNLMDANTVQANIIEDPEDDILEVNDILKVNGKAGNTAMYVYGDSSNTGLWSRGDDYGVRGYGSIGIYGSGATGVRGWATGTAVYGEGNTYDFYAAGPGTNYGSSSSMRWKENIVEIDNALDKVLDIRGVYFDWDEEHGGQHDMGFIAEEIGEIVPEIVSYEEDGIYASGVDYGALTPVLIEAIKEQQLVIQQQNDTINQLKLQMQELCLKDKTYSWCEK